MFYVTSVFIHHSIDVRSLVTNHCIYTAFLVLLFIFSYLKPFLLGVKLLATKSDENTAEHVK